jgi:hypothetical protein
MFQPNVFNTVFLYRYSLLGGLVHTYNRVFAAAIAGKGRWFGKSNGLDGCVQMDTIFGSRWIRQDPAMLTCGDGSFVCLVSEQIQGMSYLQA